MKGLEQGPESIDDNGIWMYNSEAQEPQLVGITSVPQAGITLAAKDWSLAFNFSFCRVALPPGKYSAFLLAMVPSKEEWTQEVGYDAATDSFTFEPGYLVSEYHFSAATPLDIVISVQANRITPVRIHVEKRKEESASYWYYEVLLPRTTLPIPPNPKKVSADPNSINELFELLKEKDWGFRWYAARRLAALEDRRAIQPLRKVLEKEKHIDVRKAIEGALKDSQ
jgi:hypothetical protein